MVTSPSRTLRSPSRTLRSPCPSGDITLTEENSDAIHVAAEHRDGAVFAAVLPYAPNRENTDWEFGDLAADANEPVVWVD